MDTKPISKVHQFVNEGLFKAELDQMLWLMLADDGYSGCEVRHSSHRIECIIMVTRTQSILRDKGRRIRELTALVQKRFNFKKGQLEVCRF